MRKFKLIKEYPGSPKLNTIYREVSSNKNMFIHDFEVNKPMLPLAYFYNHEFWKEIVEKEFEVIKYDRLAYGVFTISYNINAVKRLSDNTIFCIGDKIKVENSHVDKPEEITKIELNKEGVPCLFTKSFHNNGINIMKAAKCEKILATEDGVDLFENDIFWHVDTHFCVGVGILATKPGVFQPIKGYKHFSTEKAAKEYVDLNKPQYSLKDIVNSCYACGYSHIIGNVTYRLKLK